ncbi:hypothetical protein [Chryseobacterium sp. JAH]|uniref:hypothetical protein n=1 Tax=Chryseobacterium sp. JAH TaxID=1742858 RepID=UPI000740DC17|nr:hypothetical protein [Chryseobacterium sp. JAH]KUJ52481.1 hypothetical protein AR685_05530 [Chryseobacterium sp. JAH]
MKKGLIFLLMWMFVFGFSQSKLTVINEAKGTPIANAIISCNDKIIGKTNDNGFVEFSSKCKSIQITATNYYKESALVEDEMTVTLINTSAKTQSIETVILEDRSDPQALEILRRTDQLFKSNSPQSLDSYAYKSYEKVSLDIDQDSISAYNEIFNDNFNLFKKQKTKDSINDVSARKIFSKSKLFLWERAQEYLYSKKFGEKVNILDNRISGLKQPIYEMIALQGNRDKIPDQIKPENRGLYRFYLTDTIEVDGRKNFVIRFREVSYKKSAKRRKFSGYLYIDTDTYGIKKIESISKDKNDGNISSTWTFFNHKWFLSEESVKLRMSRMMMTNTESPENSEHHPKNHKKSFGTYAYLSSKYFDYESPIEENPEDFKGYTFTVKNADGKTLQKYRTQPLSDREKNTYFVIDSLGKKYNVDRKARILTGLINGQVRVGSFDFDIGEIINYNLYEGFRLGLKGKLNENFNPYFSPDYYFAYGLGDDKLKYGIGLDIKTRLNKNSFFRIEYYDDVNSSGEFYRRLWTFRMRMMNYGNNINNDKYYRYEGASISYLNDITNGLTMAFAARRNTEEAKFDYNFRNGGATFENFNTLVTLKYSPNSTNIMTPQGKSLIEQKYPELYFNFEQSFKTLGGDFNYTRFDALFVQNFKTRLGTTGVRLYGGLVLGEAPIWKHFTMNGLASPSRDINFNLTSYLGFATLEGGKFYNDRFVAYYLTHQLPWYFKSIGQNVSSFDFVLRGTIGDMKHPEYHNFRFRKLDHLYQEVGVEWNNFLSSYFNLGIFYRVGYYTTYSFKQNFALQFKLKLLEF